MTSLQTERTTFTGKLPGAAQMHPDVLFLGLTRPSSSPELVVVGVLAEKALLSTLSPRRTRGFFVTLRRFTIQPWRRCQWMWLTWFEPWDFKKKKIHTVIAIVHLHCAYIIRGGEKLLNAKPWIRILVCIKVRRLYAGPSRTVVDSNLGRRLVGDTKTWGL